jgi:peptidoglycan L-alanyl-D-glutamate endopeptidase CwlK
MDKITLERIETAHPKIREELKEDYLYCNNRLLGKGVRLRFSHVYRSKEEQDKLYAKRPKVTNAKGGQSTHNFGLAFDVVMLYDNDGNGTFETASWNTIKDGDNDGKSDWMEVVKFFKAKGWTWGGDWKSFKDKPHFEKTFGNTWRTLQEKEMFIDANGLEYPKL